MAVGSVSSPTSSLDSMKRNEEKYSVTAGIGDKNSLSTTGMTGDRENGLFAKEEEESQKMQFLKLFTEQLKYQDPTQPMDNTQFVAQLAQLTEVESITSMQTSMDKMAKIFQESIDLQNFNAQSTTNAASVSLVGKHVRLRQNTFEYNGEEKMEFTAHLGAKENAVVRIVDGDGNVVKTIELSGKDDSNAIKFPWDGTDDYGQKVLKDKYNLIIDGQESDESLYCFVEDVVTGIRYTNDGTLLRVNNTEISAGEILEVKNFNEKGNNGNGFDDGSLTMAQALGMVGLDVATKLNKVTYTPENGDLNLHVNLGATQENATLIVKDKEGNQVDSIVVSAADLDDNGEFSIPKKSYFGDSSSYTVEVSGNNQSAYLYDIGPITGVVAQNGYPQLKAMGRMIKTSDIIEIRAPEENTEEA